MTFTKEQQALIDQAAAEERARGGKPPPVFIGVDLARGCDESVLSIISERQVMGTFVNATRPDAPDGDADMRLLSALIPRQPPKRATYRWAGEPEPTPSPDLFAWQVIVDRHLGPGRLERERSRDRSCINLSAIERNKKRLAESRRVYVDERNRRFICAPHVAEELRRVIETSRGRKEGSS